MQSHKRFNDISMNSEQIKPKSLLFLTLVSKLYIFFRSMAVMELPSSENLTRTNLSLKNEFDRGKLASLMHLYEDKTKNRLLLSH